MVVILDKNAKINNDIWITHDNDFSDLEPILNKQIKDLGKLGGNIHSILEFVGPTNSQFSSLCNLFSNESQETIFE